MTVVLGTKRIQSIVLYCRLGGCDDTNGDRGTVEGIHPWSPGVLSTHPRPAALCDQQEGPAHPGNSRLHGAEDKTTKLSVLF